MHLLSRRKVLEFIKANVYIITEQVNDINNCLQSKNKRDLRLMKK